MTDKDTRTDIPSAWDERTMLMTFLDYTRATVRAKCEGLAAEHVGDAPLPGSPLMTIGGLVNHLYWVEKHWVEVMLLGGEDQGPWTDEDPDAEMRIGARLPLEEMLTAYREQCDRYNRLIAPLDLDTPSERPRGSGEPLTLRWIIFHLIEETARHAGHLDILREMADGATGD